MRIASIAAYVFWVPAVLFLGRFELHTDDTGVEVAFLLAITFILGTLHPRHAWQWGLLVGPCIPAAQVLFGGARISSGLALLLAVVVAIGMAGAYAGALLGKGLRAFSA